MRLQIACNNGYVAALGPKQSSVKTLPSISTQGKQVNVGRFAAVLACSASQTAAFVEGSLRQVSWINAALKPAASAQESAFDIADPSLPSKQSRNVDNPNCSLGGQVLSVQFETCIRQASYLSPSQLTSGRSLPLLPVDGQLTDLLMPGFVNPPTGKNVNSTISFTPGSFKVRSKSVEKSAQSGHQAAPYHEMCSFLDPAAEAKPKLASKVSNLIFKTNVDKSQV